MLTAGLTTVRTPVDVISLGVKVKMFTCITRNVIFYDFEKPGISGVPNRILRGTGRAL